MSKTSKDAKYMDIYINVPQALVSMFSFMDSRGFSDLLSQEKAKARRERAKARARESRRRSNGFLG